MTELKLSFPFLLCLGMLAGCGGGSRDELGTVPVSGTITFSGQPLAGAKIYFMSDTFTGAATTDSDGSYQLLKGALPGENHVYVTKIEGGQAVDVEGGIDENQLQIAADAAPQKTDQSSSPQEIIPEQYSDPMKSTLYFTVPEDGATDANFDL